MGTTDLKSNLHKIIERTQDEQLLRILYDFLKQKEDQPPGQLWSSLSQAQKQEVFLSFEESEEEENLVDREKVFGLPK